MLSNNAYTQEYFDIMESLGGDIESRRIAYDYMKNSTAIVHHQVISTSFVPRLYDRRTREIMRTTVETTHRILCKVIEHYLEDPDYRTIFDYDPRLAELILVPRGYDAVLPFARFDIFLDEETGEVAFCEFNGDGSSGMNENREITNSLANAKTFQEFARRHKVEPCELFDAWVEDFISIYNTYKGRVEHPRFAICDYLQNGVVDEFHLFAKKFEEHGYPCCVCDVRDLTFDGEVLHDAQGQPVHAIWRRCVTNDVLEFWDDSQALIKAVRAQKVALIGSFAGHIVHDKQICEALFHPKTQAFLTDEENAFFARTVPKTRYLDSSEIDLDEVRANKDAWIVKPTDAYGAADVYAGCFQTQEKWNEIIDRFANGAAGAVPRAALHHAVQDAHLRARPRHREPLRRGSRPRGRSVQQPGGTLLLQRALPRCVQPPGAPAYHLETHARHHRGNHLGRRVGRRSHGLGKPHRVGGVRDLPCGELRCRRVCRCRRSRQRDDFACRHLCRDHQPDDAVFARGALRHGARGKALYL